MPLREIPEGAAAFTRLLINEGYDGYEGTPFIPACFGNADRNLGIHGCFAVLCYNKLLIVYFIRKQLIRRCGVNIFHLLFNAFIHLCFIDGKLFAAESARVADYQ